MPALAHGSRALALAALALLAGCAHYTTSSNPDPASLGRSLEVPSRIVSGRATAWELLGKGPFGNDSEALAARRARGKTLEATMAGISVERHASCLFSCRWPLLVVRTTVVTGSLLAPSGYEDLPTAAKPEPSITPRDPEPTAQALAERLESLHRQSVRAAEAFYDGLGAPAREAVRERVIATRGVRPAHESELRIPVSATPEERAFLDWFLTRHTALRPVFEQP